MVSAVLGDLESGVVRVRAGTRSGTGFFIADGLIATCAHVVRSDVVTVELPDGDVVDGAVVVRAPDAARNGSWLPPDIALVAVDGPAPAIFELSRPDAPIGDRLVAVGFTVGPGDVPSLTYERPAAIATEPLEGTRMLKLVQCQLEGGMSGGPLFDERTRSVVGIIKRTRGTNAAVGGWATPVSMLDEHFGEYIAPLRAARTATLLQSYLAAVVRRSETVEPRGMRRSRDAQDIVFPLDDVYLSLETRSYHEADLDVSAGRSATSAAKEPYLGVERTSDPPQPSEASSLTRLLSNGRLTVLLGGPGSGKTTLLQWVALYAARALQKGRSHIEVGARHIDPRTASDELVTLTTARLPVAARLADYHEACAKEAARGRTLPIKEFLVSSVSEMAGDVTGELKAHVSGLIAEGKVIVLLDGMDELREVSHRQEVRDAILAFASEFAVEDGVPRSGAAQWLLREVAPGQPTILVTSRHAGYRDAALQPDLFEHALIAPLTDEAVRRFLLNWNLAVRRWSLGADSPDELTAEAERRAAAIDDALGDRPSLRAIARTPLLLTVITLVHEELGRLPQQRTDLLLEMGRILVERRATGHSFLDAGDILGPVALWMHEHRATGLLSKAEFSEHVRRHFPRLVVHDPGGGTVRAMADRFCADAEEQFGLIVERGPDLVGFQHRMLQEFFVALEITSWSDDPFAAISDRLFDPQWREVVIFVVCLETKASAQRGRHLMRRLLSGDEEESAPAEHRRQAMFLAADCLAEIERSLPEVEVQVIRQLVDLACGSSSARQAPDVTEAITRLRAIAPLLSEAADVVLTSAYREASIPRRRRLCEIVSTLRIDAPGLRALLELRDPAPGVGLAERAALLQLQNAQTAEHPTVRKLAEMPEWAAPAYQHLLRFGESHAGEALSRLLDDPAVPAESALDAYCEELRKITATAVGVEAVLAGTALLIIRPETLLRTYEAFVARELIVEASELLIWSAQNTRVSAGALERWSELDREYRSYVLATLLARGPSRDGARTIAWAEVELTAASRSEEVPERDSQALLSAMMILNSAAEPALTTEQFTWLDELAARDALVALRAGFSLASSTLDRKAEIAELLPRSAPGRWFKAIAAAERSQLSGNTLREIVDASGDPSGVWRMRTDRVLTSPSRYCDLAESTLTALDEIKKADNLASGTALKLQRFTGSITMDSAAHAPRLLTGELPPEIFARATPEVDDLLVDWAAGEAPGRERAVEALCARRNWGGVETLPLVARDAPVLRVLLESQEEEDAILAGLMLARAAMASEHDVSVVVGRLEDGAYPEPTSLELALWIGQHGLVPESRVEQLASSAVDRWPGPLGVAIAARLLATTGDSGLRFIRALKLSNTAAVEALLLAGDHPIVWSFSADQASMRGLSVLVGGLCVNPDMFETVVAACSQLLHDGSDWPKARFALHQVMELGARAPDAVSVLAAKHDLVTAVSPYLAAPLSFGVRMRAFAVLARAGRLTNEMFDALVTGAHDTTEVLTRVFESLRFIRAVDDSVIPRIEATLEEGGLAAVAALDATRHLVHSYAFDEDPALRNHLVGSLMRGSYEQSPWAVCSLPFGLSLSLQQTMLTAMFAVVTTTDRIGEIRPIMLTRPPAARPARVQLDPTTTFADGFLARVREHLSRQV